MTECDNKLDDRQNNLVLAEEAGNTPLVGYDAFNNQYIKQINSSNDVAT